MTEPRDPFSEVVDTNRRWSPEWYSWLKEISSAVSSVSGGGSGGSGPSSTVPWCVQTGTPDAMLASIPSITTLNDGQLIGVRKVGNNTSSSCNLKLNSFVNAGIVGPAFGQIRANSLIDQAELLLRWNGIFSNWVLCNEGAPSVENAGATGMLGGNKVFFGWTGSHPQITVDSTNIGNVVTDNPTFSATLMPAVQKMMSGLPNGPANVVNQGADPTGGADCSSIIQNTMNTYGIAYLPKGFYRSNTTLVLPNPNHFATALSATGLIGEGWANTVLFASTNLTTDIVQLANAGPGGNYGAIIKGMSITRNSLATSGYGLNAGVNDSTNTYDHVILEDLYLSNHGIGIHLGGANPGWSHARHIHAEQNRLDGFEIHGTWQLLDLYATLNGRHGFSVDASGDMSNGQWRGLSTFGNSGIGFAVLGAPGRSIQALRVSDSFFGADGAQEIYLDSYATGHGSLAHVFTNVYCEQPSQVTPNSNCIEVTANNPDISFINCCASGGKPSGTDTGRALNWTAPTTLLINGGRYETTGTATAIAVTNGQCSIMGCIARAATIAGGAAVAIAALGTGGNNCTHASIIGCNATTGPTFAGSAITNSANVIGYSAGNYP